MAQNRYKNGKIYRLINSVDKEEYIGSTCNSLAKRVYNHKDKAKRCPDRKVYKHLERIGWDNVSIILIEEYACENKMQLERRERHWIETRKPTLNTAIPTRTRKEYNKDTKEKKKEINAKYKAENKDRLLEQSATYRAENKDKIKEKDAKYHKANRDTILEKQKQYRANNRESIKANLKAYYEANKETLKAKQREKYALKNQAS